LDKVYQVFVSSTFSDLEEERRQINDALAKAGYLVAGMELFPATDQQQLDFIKRVIDRSDYYVVVVAGRYGSLAEDGKSFTEHEYGYARSKGIPVLAFVHAEPGKLPVDRSDTDPNALAKLEAFREALKTGRIVKFWHGIEELCREVIIATTQATNLMPGHGWVRGDQAIDPKVLQEMEKLRIENGELKKQIGERDTLAFDPTIPGPDDVVNLTINRKDSDGMGRTEKEQTISVENRFGDVFVGIYDNLLATPLESEIANYIGRLHSGEFSSPIGVYTRFSLPPEKISEIRLTLEGQDLIAVMSQGERPARKAWSPTPKGRKYYLAKRLKKID
jgi:hypothetical protein